MQENGEGLTFHLRNEGITPEMMVVLHDEDESESEG